MKVDEDWGHNLHEHQCGEGTGPRLAEHHDLVTLDNRSFICDLVLYIWILIITLMVVL